METGRLLCRCLAALALLTLAAGLEPATAQDQPPYLQPPNTHYQTALADLKGGNTDKAALEAKLAIQENPLDTSSRHYGNHGPAQPKGPRYLQGEWLRSYY